MRILNDVLNNHGSPHITNENSISNNSKQYHCTIREPPTSDNNLECLKALVHNSNTTLIKNTFRFPIY